MRYVIIKDGGNKRYFFNGFVLLNSGLHTKWNDPSLERGITTFVAYPTRKDVEEVISNIPVVEREGIEVYQLELVAPK